MCFSITFIAQVLMSPLAALLGRRRVLPLDLELDSLMVALLAKRLSNSFDSSGSVVIDKKHLTFPPD